MKSPLFWALVVAVAVWQIEMAVHSGLEAARRTAPTKASASTNRGNPICTGTLSCPPPQPSQLTPRRVIVTHQ